MIIYDDPADDPRNYEEPAERDEVDCNPINRKIRAALDAERPERYMDTDWQEPVIEMAVGLLMEEDPDKVIKDRAKRMVIACEGQAKAAGTNLLAELGQKNAQLPLGYGTEQIKEFLIDKWHLPLTINTAGYVVTLGAMTNEDFKEFEAFMLIKAGEQEQKLAWTRDGLRLLGMLFESLQPESRLDSTEDESERDD